MGAADSNTVGVTSADDFKTVGVTSANGSLPPLSRSITWIKCNELGCNRDGTKKHDGVLICTGCFEAKKVALADEEGKL